MTKGSYDVYASAFMTTRDSLADILSVRTTDEAIRNRGTIRQSLGCSSLLECDELLRHIVAEDQHFSVVALSKEEKYPGSTIVVNTDKPLVKNFVGGDSLEQRVTRYWYDIKSKELAYEELFSMAGNSRNSFIADIQVFDDLVIFLESDSAPACPVNVSDCSVSSAFSSFAHQANPAEKVSQQGGTTIKVISLEGNYGKHLAAN